MPIARKLYYWLWGRYGFRAVFLGLALAQSLYVTAKLGLPDILHKGAKSCSELAAEMSVNELCLLQLLRLLTKLGFVSVDKNDNYQLTPLGLRLCSDTPNSLRGTVLSTGSLLYPAWGNLLHSIQTGNAAFDRSFGMSMYEYLTQNSEANSSFNLWMKETTKEWIVPVLKTYDFSKVRNLVDVGGGSGFQTAMILQKHPQLQAILFDREEVVSEANQEMSSASVASRCQVRCGDFFDSVPPGGDLYLISRVLLNWDDERALQILNNCRYAMTNSAKLLIMDFILPNKGVSLGQLLSSINLLVLGGKTMRTESEYYQLLEKAGFQSPKLIKTKGMIDYIEAVLV